MANAVTRTTAHSGYPASRKRRRRSKQFQRPAEEKSLLPGLPDHVAQLCLSHVDPSLLFSVCSSWRRLIYSPSFPPFLSLYALLSSDYHHNNSIHLSSFDPISTTWHHIPLPPQLSIVHRHPSFISRNLPIQTISVCGNLILLAGTTHNFLPALPRPLIFNPLSQTWRCGPALSSPRRWCAVGALGDAVYVASGIGSHYRTDVARSMEKWDLQESKGSGCEWEWMKMKGIRDGRFCRDAVDAVGWRGKLCMVNVKGDAAKEGVVYDVERDEWEAMPEGMVAGWRGPVAAMDEEVIYGVEESKGALRRYNPRWDGWDEVIESERLKGAEQMVAAKGKVCVVHSGGSGIAVVDVVASRPRMWLLECPPGFRAISLHILPRMTRN